MTEKRNGKQNGNKTYDWAAAFVAYFEMGHGRSLSELARQMGASKETVLRNARQGSGTGGVPWHQQVEALEGRARDKAQASLVRERAQRVADTLRIIDASRAKFAKQLQYADFRLTGGDFVGIMKLEALLEGEATDRVAVADLQPLLEAFTQTVMVLEQLARQVDEGAAAQAIAHLDAELARLASSTHTAETEPVAA